jgi:hypothetical protein
VRQLKRKSTGWSGASGRQNLPVASGPCLRLGKADDLWVRVCAPGAARVKINPVIEWGGKGKWEMHQEEAKGGACRLPCGEGVFVARPVHLDACRCVLAPSCPVVPCRPVARRSQRGRNHPLDHHDLVLRSNRSKVTAWWKRIRKSERAYMQNLIVEGL